MYAKMIFLILFTVLIVMHIGIIFGVVCGAAAGSEIRNFVRGSMADGQWSGQVFGWCVRGIPLARGWSKLREGKSYVVLLQNNNELRPSGGFMGSYVRIVTDKRGLRGFEVQDIYQPDGQLPGHVEPPIPIQEAFGQGWWKLRDANWAIDFSETARTVAWFMEHGGEEDIDGIAAVTLDLFEKWIGILGEVRPATYDEVVTRDNLYELAQRYAESKRDKRGFLGAVGVALVERTKKADLWELARLGVLFMREAGKGQVLVWFKSGDLQADAEKLGIAGRLGQGWDGESDYLHIVESNLGANKANCCVSKQVIAKVGQEKEGLRVRVVMEWVNRDERSLAGEFWGGEYVSYVRLALPNDNRVTGVWVGGRELKLAKKEDLALPASLRRGIADEIFYIEDLGEFKSAGFWVRVPLGGRGEAEVQYERPASAKRKLGKYEVLVKRQPGAREFPFRIEAGDKVALGGIVDRDKKFAVRLAQ